MRLYIDEDNSNDVYIVDIEEDFIRRFFPELIPVLDRQLSYSDAQWLVHKMQQYNPDLQLVDIPARVWQRARDASPWRTIDGRVFEI
jgi:hypothetical protein